MRPIYLLTNVPYNLEDIPLGGLLSDIRYPNQDVLNVANVGGGPADVAVRTESNIQHDLQTSERSWFDAQISRLVAASYQRSSNDGVRISSYEGRIYELKQPFKENASTRFAIEESNLISNLGLQRRPDWKTRISGSCSPRRGRRLMSRMLRWWKLIWTMTILVWICCTQLLWSMEQRLSGCWPRSDVYSQ